MQGEVVVLEETFADKSQRQQVLKEGDNLYNAKSIKTTRPKAKKKYFPLSTLSEIMI